ncbi:helix-turn-helix domain-containing protein [Sphingobacterium multivorum]|uniref:helix-turn-helix domain-containing protein n=1 Tax=Sphingobacterium multivorum TaxID=28454 RepID=UPI0031BA021C
MKKALYIHLETVFGEARQPEDSTLQPHIPMSNGESRYYRNASGQAYLQEFDGLLAYINILDVKASNRMVIPLRILQADLHLFYLIGKDGAIQIKDMKQDVTYTISSSRGRYIYLPSGDYALHLPGGSYTLFNFYFRGSIFRNGNERPFRFLHPLIDAYRSNSPLSSCSVDFRVGSITIARLQHFVLNLRAGDLDNDKFIYEELNGLIKLSKKKIFNEYERQLGSDQEAQDIYDEMKNRISRHGQEFRIAALCDFFGKSQQYIGRIYRKKYKQSLQAGRKQLLIEHIKQQILLDDSISHVAYSCGFNSIHHFSNFFKQETGLSPSEYLDGFRKEY